MREDATALLTYCAYARDNREPRRLFGLPLAAPEDRRRLGLPARRAACPACGAPAQRGARFCSSCGSPLDPGS